MHNILIAGDLHIDKASLEECSLILQEQKELIKQYNIDTYISTGDNFDHIKPGSEELDLFSTFLRDINIPSIIVAAQSHESTTPEETVLNHFEILNNNIKVVKEYQDDNHLYCGHFIVKEATKNFGATISKNSLKKFKFVFLGHQHEHEIIKPNICQLGSCRWVDFSESQDKNKLIAIISNYGEDKERVNFIALKSPYKMIDIVVNSSINNKFNELGENDLKNASKEAISGTNLEQKEDKGKDSSKSNIAQTHGSTLQNPRQITSISELCAILDKIDPKTKIRVVFKDYGLWTEFLPFYPKYKEKFIIFKDKKDFLIETSTIQNKEKNITLKESLIKWLEKNKVNDKIKDILLEEIK